MKKSIVVLVTLLGLASCSEKAINNSVQVDDTTTHGPAVLSTSDSSQTSDNTSSNTSNTSSNTTSSTTDSSYLSSSNVKPSELQVITVASALEKGKSLAIGQKGETIKLQVQYLQTLTFSNSNQDVMFLTDNTGYIGLLLSYSDYQGYLANRYTDNPYTVIAALSNVNGQVLLTLDESLTVQESFVSLSEDVTFDIKALATTHDTISSIVNAFSDVKLNSKKFGYGEVVKFEAQLVSTEYSNSGKKALFYDGTSTITVVSTSKIASEEDIGKTYEIVGLMSVERTSPALWLLDKTITDSTIKPIDVSKATEVKASDFQKYTVLGDDYNSPDYVDYTKLYKTTGYIKTDSGRTKAYYIGMVDTINGSLNDNGIKSVPGFYFLNNQNLDERGVTYSPFYDYLEEDITLTVYYTLNQFDSSNHAWKVFGLESLIS